jgi:probable phosphoglycerate mutase
MLDNDQKVYVIRHGETEWSLNGRHTGITDIPLTDKGRKNARLLRPVLAKESFGLVLTSPLQRARETCELAGLGQQAEIDQDLLEWNYGEYEGVTSEEIHKENPGWIVFTHGSPGGESPEDVAHRVDRIIVQVRGVKGHVALFAHGHVLRVLAARWLDLSPQAGRHFLLDTGTLNVLSYYRGFPAVKRWNAELFI